MTESHIKTYTQLYDELQQLRAESNKSKYDIIFKLFQDISQILHIKLNKISDFKRVHMNEIDNNYQELHDIILRHKNNLKELSETISDEIVKIENSKQLIKFFRNLLEIIDYKLICHKNGKISIQLS